MKMVILSAAQTRRPTYFGASQPEPGYGRRRCRGGKLKAQVNILSYPERNYDHAVFGDALLNDSTRPRELKTGQLQ